MHKYKPHLLWVQNISLRILFICITLFFFKESICQSKFHIRISDNLNVADTLFIGEAYFNDAYKSVKFDSETFIKEDNSFTITGYMEYPTAIRVFSGSTSHPFNQMIFLDTGISTYNLIVSNDKVNVIGVENDETHAELIKFLNYFDVTDVSVSLNTQKLLAYAENNRKSFVTLYALINQCYFNNITGDAIHIINLLDDSLKKTKAFSAFSKEFFPGKKIGNIELKNKYGIRHNLSIIENSPKYTLIEFWFLGCKPCINNMDALNNHYNELKGTMRLISINTDSKKKAIKFSKKLVKVKKLEWEQFWDFDGNESEKLIDLYSYPTNILIDINGNIVVKNVDLNSVVDIVNQMQLTGKIQ